MYSKCLPAHVFCLPLSCPFKVAFETPYSFAAAVIELKVLLSSMHLTGFSPTERPIARAFSLRKVTLSSVRFNFSLYYCIVLSVFHSICCHNLDLDILLLVLSSSFSTLLNDVSRTLDSWFYPCIFLWLFVKFSF